MITRTLSNKIDSVFLEKQEENRDYIGASSIGNPCERAIWYRYNKISGDPLPPKNQRTLAIGKRLEGLVLDCIEETGIKLLRFCGKINDSEIEIFQGNVDAVWLREDGSQKAIIEVKTARDSSFKIFVNKGLKNWYPTYYSQLQAYMGMSGLHKSYLIALNKDTSELHDEFVGFDALYYEDLKRKVKRIAEASEAPCKINNSPLYYICRSCSFKRICHGSEQRF